MKFLSATAGDTFSKHTAAYAEQGATQRVHRHSYYACCHCVRSFARLKQHNACGAINCGARTTQICTSLFVTVSSRVAHVNKAPCLVCMHTFLWASQPASAAAASQPGDQLTCTRSSFHARWITHEHSLDSHTLISISLIYYSYTMAGSSSRY